MTDTNMTSDEIIAIRERLGWSRKDLAVWLRRQKSTIAGWELGYGAPNGHALRLLRQLATMAANVPRPTVTLVTCGCGCQHAAGERCPICQCDYTPSPEEIAAARDAISGGWSDAERLKHCREYECNGWEVPTVRNRGGRRMRDREGSHDGD